MPVVFSNVQLKLYLETKWDFFNPIMQCSIVIFSTFPKHGSFLLFVTHVSKSILSAFGGYLFLSKFLVIQIPLNKGSFFKFNYIYDWLIP